MPEGLLQQLKTAEPAASIDLEILEQQESEIERMRLAHVRQVEEAVKGMRGTALIFVNAWTSVIIDVVGGHATEIQAIRKQLLELFAARLDQLKRVQALVDKTRKMHGEDAIPGLDFLSRETNRMEQLKSTVFDRWETLEDLEDLVARDYPLTAADLDRIGPQCRPPASWYAEESKPF
jgi:hypothetical protein